MARRVYIKSASTMPVAFAAESGWVQTSQAVERELVLAKGTSSIAGEGTFDGAAGSAITLMVKAVSAPLKGCSFTTACTVKAQFLVREFATSDNVDRPQIYLVALSNDGATVLGTILARNLYVSANEFLDSGYRNQKFADGDTCQNAMTLPDGWRLGVQLGGRCFTGTTPQMSIKTGEDATDLPEDNTTTTDGAGWIELSEDFEYLQPAAGTLAAPAGAASGTSTVTGTGAPSLAAPTGAASGTSEVGGSGAPSLAAPTGAASGTSTVTGTGSGAAAGATGAGSGTSIDAGDAAGTLAAPTGAAAGTPVVSGSGAPAIAAPTGAASGTSAVTGAGAPAIAAPTGSGTGLSAITGSGSGGLGGASGSGSGTTTVTGAAAGTLAAPTGDGGAGISGGGAGVLAAPTGAGSGTTRVTGTGAGAMGAPVGAGAGSPRVSGTAAGTLRAPTGLAAVAVASLTPMAVVSVASWVAVPSSGNTVASVTDDAVSVADDATTYARLPAGVESASFTVSLAAWSDPGVSHSHFLRIRARATSNVDLTEFGAAPGLPDQRTTVELLVGTTVVATRVVDIVSTSWTTFSWELAPREVEAIRAASGYGSLRMRVTAGSLAHDHDLAYEPWITSMQLDVPGAPATVPALRVTTFHGEALCRTERHVVDPIPLPDILPELLRVNWAGGVEVESSWLTDVSRSVYGDLLEERREMRDRPVRSMTADLAGFRRPDAMRALMLASRMAKQRCPVPLYSDHSRIDEDADADEIVCETRWRRFFVGGRVVAHAWGEDANGSRVPVDVQIRGIAEILDDRLVLDAPLDTPLSAGSRVLPLLDAEIGLSANLTAASDDVLTMRVEAFEVEGPSALPPLATVSGIDEVGFHAGYPILDLGVDWSSGTSIDVERSGESFGLGRGTVVSPDGSRAQLSHELPYKALTRAAAWAFLRFFDSRRGRSRPFWLAAPQSLLRVSWIAPFPNMRQIDIDAVGSIDDFEEFVRRIAVVMRDGTVRILDVESVDDNGATWRIHTAADLPAGMLIGNVRRCAVAHFVRFDSDTLTESWRTDEVCEFRPRVVELLGDGDVDIQNVTEEPTFGEGEIDDPSLYLWCMSDRNAWQGDHPGASTRRVERCFQKLTPAVDFWDDVRVNGEAVVALGQPFPKPFLARRLDSASTGPFFVLFRSWKKAKGKPVIEHSGTTGAEFWLENDGAPIWDNEAGMTLFFAARLKATEQHFFVRRKLGATNVLEWSHDTVRIGPSYVQVGADMRGSANRLFVLRWRPAARLDVWRSGKQTILAAVLVPGSIDTTPTDTEILKLQSEVDGPQGQSGIKQQGYSMGLKIFRRALTDEEIDDVGKQFRKLYGCKWRSIV